MRLYRAPVCRACARMVSDVVSLLTGGSRALNPWKILLSFPCPGLLERCAQKHFLHLTFGEGGEHIGYSHDGHAARLVISDHMLYPFGIISCILTAQLRE